MDIGALIDTYCQAWSLAEPERRATLLRQVWAEDATYTDPTTHARGAAELLAHIATVLARRPDSRVLRSSEVDLHHGLARFAWRAVEADGNQLVEGIDIAFISADATKIDRIIGFFGAAPPDLGQSGAFI